MTGRYDQAGWTYGIMGALRRVNDEEYYRIGPLQDALVTPGVRGQSQLQGEHPGVEGGQVVPLLPTGHHLQDCPGEHLDSNSELFTEKIVSILVKAFLVGVLLRVVIGAHLEREVSLDRGHQASLENPKSEHTITITTLWFAVTSTFTTMSWPGLSIKVSKVIRINLVKGNLLQLDHLTDILL